MCFSSEAPDTPLTGRHGFRMLVGLSASARIRTPITTVKSRVSGHLSYGGGNYKQ